MTFPDVKPWEWVNRIQAWQDEQKQIQDAKDAVQPYLASGDVEGARQALAATAPPDQQADPFADIAAKIGKATAAAWSGGGNDNSANPPPTDTNEGQTVMPGAIGRRAAQYDPPPELAYVPPADDGGWLDALKGIGEHIKNGVGWALNGEQGSSDPFISPNDYYKAAHPGAASFEDTASAVTGGNFAPHLPGPLDFLASPAGIASIATGGATGGPMGALKATGAVTAAVGAQQGAQEYGNTNLPGADIVGSPGFQVGAATVAGVLGHELTGAGVRAGQGLLPQAGEALRTVNAGEEGALTLPGGSPRPAVATALGGRITPAPEAPPLGMEGDLLQTPVRTQPATAQEVLDEAKKLNGVRSGVVGQQVREVASGLAPLGPMVQDAQGNWYFREITPSHAEMELGAAVDPENGLGKTGALVNRVLERPDEYGLTPEQRAAVAKVASIADRATTEAESRGADINRLGMEEGQQYAFRKVVKPSTASQVEALTTSENPAANTATGGTPGTARLGGGKLKSRIYDDPAQAVADGVVYDHPLAAAQTGIAQRLKLAADTHVANGLKPFGETAADRMDPQLRASYQDAAATAASLRDKVNTALSRAGVATGKADELDKALSAIQDRTPTQPGQMAKLPGIADRLSTQADTLATSANPADVGRGATIDSVVNKFTSAIPEDVDRIRYLENSLNQTAKRISDLRARGGDWGATADQLQQDYAAAQTNLDQIRPQYQDAMTRARQTLSPGYRTVPMENAPALAGTSFPEPLAKKIGSLYGVNPGGLRGSLMNLDQSVTGVINRRLNMLHTTFDLATPARLLPTSPAKAWTEAAGLAAKSLVDPDAIAQFYAEHDANPIGLTTQEMATRGLNLSSVEQDVGRGLNWSRSANPVKGAIGRAQQIVNEFPAALRVKAFDQTYADWAAAGEDVSNLAVQEQIAHITNLATGATQTRVPGLPSLVAFPRWTTASVEFLVKAAADGTMEGAYAREALLKHIGLWTATAYAANTAQGKPTDFSKGIPTIWIGDQQLSIPGKYGQFAKAVAMSAQDGGNPTRGAEYLVRSNLSPLAATLTDLWQGSSLGGDKATLNPINSPSYWSKIIMPFGAQSVDKNAVTTPGGFAQWMAGNVGLRARDMTPTEQLDELAANYGPVQTPDGPKTFSSFYNMPPGAQADISAKHPELVQEAIAHGSAARQQYQGVKSQMQTEQQANDADLIAGKLSLSEWTKAADNRKQRTIQAAQDAYGPSSGSSRDKYLDPYFKTLDANTKNGVTDWTAIDEWKAAQPKAVQDYIDQNTGLSGTPLQKLKSKLANAYYSLPRYAGFTGDQASQIDQLRQNVRNAAGSSDEARNLRALRTLDTSGYPPAVVNAVRRQISVGLTELPARANWMKAHPEGVLIAGRGQLGTAQIAAIQRAMGQ